MPRPPRFFDRFGHFVPVDSIEFSLDVPGRAPKEVTVIFVKEFGDTWGVEVAVHNVTRKALTKGWYGTQRNGLFLSNPQACYALYQ